MVQIFTTCIDYVSQDKTMQTHVQIEFVSCVIVEMWKMKGTF